MITIIKATKSNLIELSSLDESIFKETAYGRESISSELNNNKRIYYIAFENEKPVGFVGATLAYDTADVMKVGVLECHRGKSIAKQLLNTLFDNLIQIGIKFVMLEVREINTSAINLYEGLNFKKISKRVSYYANGENAYIYKLNL